jgi:hypothetical protein
LKSGCKGTTIKTIHKISSPFFKKEKIGTLFADIGFAGEKSGLGPTKTGNNLLLCSACSNFAV